MAKPGHRILFIEGVLALAAVAVLGRSFMLQVVQHKQWEALAKAQRSLSKVVPARRGRILDRYGDVLAISQEHYHISIALNEVKDTAKLKGLLIRDVRIPAAQVEKAFAEEYPYFNGPFKAEQIASIRAVKGVTPEVLYDRVYPRKSLALPLLGRLNEAGDAGIEGLEKSLDTLLRGTPGLARYKRDAKGKLLDFPGEPFLQPIPGRDVVLSIDQEVQGIAESVLRDAVDKFQSRGGDVVIIDVHTGELFALASLRTDAVRGFIANPAAIIEPYEPGSTSKLFTAASMLRWGRDTTPVSAENGIWMMPVGNGHTRKIEDAHAETGMLTLGETIKHSSNIGISKFAIRLEPEQQYQTIRNFGFGTKPDINFPGEASGRLTHPKLWVNHLYTQASLGQGYEWMATALQLATAYAAIADTGVLHTPTLVSEVRDSDRVLWRHRPEVVRQAVPASVARQLMDYLRLAADSGGTGVKSQLDRYQIFGKTGTAVIPPYGKTDYRASFAGVFPGDKPQWVVYMMIDHPRGLEHFGGGTAAPMVKAMLQQALALQRSPLDRSRLTAPTVALAAVSVETPLTDAPRRVALPMVQQVSQTNTALLGAVPLLVGSTARQAVLTLNQMGYEVRLVGRGKVRSTSPSAGDSLARGQTVTVRADSLR